MLAKNVLIMVSLMLLFGCESYKKSGFFGNTSTNVSDGGGGGNGATRPPSIPTEKPTELILAADKLKANPGSYKAVIKYSNASLEAEITPTSASEIQILLTGLPSDESSVMTVELLQGGKLKFVAKRAHTKLAKNQANRVVIDSCLILSVPWLGAQHDGSCEWVIADK